MPSNVCQITFWSPFQNSLALLNILTFFYHINRVEPRDLNSSQGLGFFIGQKYDSMIWWEKHYEDQNVNMLLLTSSNQRLVHSLLHMPTSHWAHCLGDEGLRNGLLTDINCLIIRIEMMQLHIYVRQGWNAHYITVAEKSARESKRHGQKAGIHCGDAL